MTRVTDEMVKAFRCWKQTEFIGFGSVAEENATRLRLEAALAAASAESEEWRDIATAPKTDVKILRAISILCWVPDDTAPDGGDQFVLWWEPLMNKKNGCWYNGEMELFPTHWRPLPPPPASDEGAAT